MKTGYLIYLIENCIKDFDALKRVNIELANGMSLSSKLNIDVNHLGILNRSIQGYLIIKAGSLFDRDSRSISLFNLLDEKVNEMKNKDIIKKIINTRNKFIAHNDFKYLEDEKFGLATSEIINSNLKEILEQSKTLVGKINTL